MFILNTEVPPKHTQFSSVAQSCLTLCDPMDRLPCPSPTYSNSCLLSWWCDPHHIKYVFIHKHIRLNETINIKFTKLLGGCIFLHIQKFFWFWCYPYYLANLLSCLVKIKNWIKYFFFLTLKCLLCVWKDYWFLRIS